MNSFPSISPPQRRSKEMKRTSRYEWNELFPKKPKKRNVSSDVRQLYELIKHRVVDDNTVQPNKQIIGHMDIPAIFAFIERFKSSKKKIIITKKLKALIQRLCPTLILSDDEWTTLMLRIDLGKGKVSWESFNSYLLLEYKERQMQNPEYSSRYLEDPIKGQPHVVKGRHKYTICDIAFQPFRRKDGTWSYQDGKYVTISREGGINVWSLNLELEAKQLATSQFLAPLKTHVTGIESLPDIDMLATISTEREIRFYDTVGKRYNLKTVIMNLPQPAVSLCYNFHNKGEEPSSLVIGDCEGSIIVIKIDNRNGGPLKNFERTLSTDFQQIKYYFLRKGTYADVGLTMFNYSNIHPCWVQQIKWFKSLNAFVTCASSSKTSVAILDPVKPRIINTFSCYRGVFCICVMEKMSRIATGGFDCVLRIWDSTFNKNTIADLHGHLSPIVHISEQFKGQVLFSLSKNKVIKVWDTISRTCRMTYVSDLAVIGNGPLVSFYNPHYKTFIMASTNIGMIKISSGGSMFYSDGVTHAAGVTKALYNRTLSNLVTVGVDSIIQKWDLTTGTRIMMTRDAHVNYDAVEERSIAILTAAFSPSELELITGAADGTLKIWNYVHMECLKSLLMESGSAVMSVMWYESKILACGWNKHIIEWEAMSDENEHKKWEMYHSDLIVSASLCDPIAVATGSYNGELVMCYLKNGLYYRKADVGTPYKRRTNYSALYRKQGIIAPCDPIQLDPTQANTVPATDLLGLSADDVTQYLGIERGGEEEEGVDSENILNQVQVSSGLSVLSSDQIRTPSSSSGDSTADNVTDPLTPDISKSSTKIEIPSSLSFPTPSNATAASENKQNITSSNPTVPEEKAPEPEPQCKCCASGITCPATHRKGETSKVVTTKKLPVDANSSTLFDLTETTAQHKLRYERIEISVIHYIKQRPMEVDVGSLLIAVRTGWIQLWSHHPYGGVVSSFYAARTISDFVTCIATDNEGKFLYTGKREKHWSMPVEMKDTHHPLMFRDLALSESTNEVKELLFKGHHKGYIRIWYIRNYGLPDRLKVIENNIESKLILNFPHMIKVQMSVEQQKGDPIVVSSCRNHMGKVSHIELINSLEVYVSCGNDKAVRVWTLRGLYVGVLGGSYKWPKLSREGILVPKVVRIPADLKRVISSLSQSILKDQDLDTRLSSNELKSEAKKSEIKTVYRLYRSRCTYANMTDKFSIPARYVRQCPDVKINVESPVLRVLKTLEVMDIGQIERPETPVFIRHSRRLRQHSCQSNRSMKSIKRPASVSGMDLAEPEKENKERKGKLKSEIESDWSNVFSEDGEEGEEPIIKCNLQPESERIGVIKKATHHTTQMRNLEKFLKYLE